MMIEPKNVQIPYELFNAILDTLEYIDMSNYAEDFQNQFTGILVALQDKKNRMALREDYGKLIAANKTGDEGKKFDARAQYLQNKNRI